MRRPSFPFVPGGRGRTRGGALGGSGRRGSVHALPARWARAAATVLVGGLLACKKAPPPPPPPPVVRVAPAERRDVEETHEWLATLDGSTNAAIRAQVTGTVVQVPYHEGTVVRRGDVLFVLDRRPFVAAVQRALGNYESAVAQLRKARADVSRYTPLVAARALSAEILANARAAVETGVGNVQAAKGALDAARLDLDWTDVRSPIAGLAGIAQTRVGNLVNPTQVLTTVSTLDPIRASFSISEREYLDHAEVLNDIDDPKYVNRRYFELILLDGRPFPYHARRVVVNRQLDPSTGTLLIYALFPNPGNVLRPGLTARIRLHTGIQRDVLVVPERAVEQLQGTYRVAVVGPDQRVRIQRITVGPLVDHAYVVTGGLAPDARVVVDGQQNAHPGALVRVEAAPAQQTAAAPGQAGPPASAPSPAAPAAPGAPAGGEVAPRQGRSPPAAGRPAGSR